MDRVRGTVDPLACHPAVPAVQVLRLEPHVVISNRTPVPLQLLQSRLSLVTPPPPGAAGRRGLPPRPSGAVVAEGGSSFRDASGRGFSASPLWAGGGCSGWMKGQLLLCV